MTYREAEAYINQIPRFSKIKSPDNVALILETFGNPQLSFKYIHVAGTNGKGSVCAYLDSCLRTLGIRTGLFTSPHLISTTERFKVDGRDMTEGEFLSIFDRLMAVVRSQMEKGYPHPTYFEFIYLMGMIWFGEQEIAFGVIETGLGGRLDATNCVDRPALTVITSISLDHTEILGDTVELIAAEKAGIIKEGVPVICDGSDRAALSVIMETAKRRRAKCLPVYPEQIKNVLNNGENIDFSYQDGYDNTYDILIHTVARYQVMNSILAFEAMRELAGKGDIAGPVSDEMLLKGLFDMFWPGRFQEILPGICVDGAHNASGIEKLAESLEADAAGRPLWILFAVASDKDLYAMAERLSRLPDLSGIMLTEITGYRKTDLKKVAQAFAVVYDGPVLTDPDIASAIRAAGDRAKREGALLVCTGSLYLTGSILEVLR